MGRSVGGLSLVCAKPWMLSAGAHSRCYRSTLAFRRWKKAVPKFKAILDYIVRFHSWLALCSGVRTTEAAWYHDLSFLSFNILRHETIPERGLSYLPT